jgi:hypothetical protein
MPGIKMSVFLRRFKKYILTFVTKKVIPDLPVLARKNGKVP